MLELWQQALLPFNLPLTVALGLVLLFWLLVMLGAMGVDSLNVEASADLGDSDGFSLPDAIGKMTNAADIPVTIVLSLFILFLWGGSVIGNFYLNPEGSNLLGMGILVGGVVISIALTKLVTQPLVPLMRGMREAEKAPPVIGQSGIVRSGEVDATWGQVLVEREGGAPALLLCRTAAGVPPIPRGTEVLVVSHDDAGKRYIVRPMVSGYESAAISEATQGGPGQTAASPSLSETDPT